jgi:hypothetical protein
VPLTSSNIVNQAMGGTGAGAGATSFDVTLPAVTDGNTVIVFATNSLTGVGLATPAGWARDALIATGRVYVFRRDAGTAGASIAGETTWNFLPASNTPRYAWIAYELSGLDPEDPYDSSVATAGTTSPATTGTLTLAQSYQATDAIAFAVHAGQSPTAVAPAWSAQTGGFVEDMESATTAGAATDNCSIAASILFPGNVTPTLACAATFTAAATKGAVLVVYKSADSPMVGALLYHTGFEYGFAGGLTTGNAAQRLATSVGTNVTLGTNAQILAGSAKNGGYGLRLTAAAQASLAVRWAGGASTILGATMYNNEVLSFWLRVVSASGVSILASVHDNTSGINTVDLVYDASTSKLGVRWTDATTPLTATYQAGTTATGTWVRVSILVSGYRRTTKTMQWSLDGVAETSLADRTGASLGSAQYAALGHSWVGGSSTFVADYDDVQVSVDPRTHTQALVAPKVVLLGVDPAGTVSLSGTAANFNTYTNNATLAAWNVTTARNAVDEVPPTVGATADGVAQITLAASDYMQFPMSTYTLAQGEYIVGVRAIVCGWGAGAPAAATIGLRGFDGTTETVLWAVADPSFNNSTTTPGWLSCRWLPSVRWTQAMLNAAALRLGFSGDATPDIGAHALYLEVTIGTVATRALFGDMATMGEDPDWSAAVNIAVAAPAMGTGDTSLTYEESGSPTIVPVPEGTTVTETVDAPDTATVNRITMVWPPEPDPVD